MLTTIFADLLLPPLALAGMLFGLLLLALLAIGLILVARTLRASD